MFHLAEGKAYITNITTNIYRELQQHLNKLPIGYPETESGVEIELLKLLFTPEEALIATNMRLFPEPLKKIHRRVKKYGIKPKELEEVLARMYKKGSISASSLETENGIIKQYRIAFLAVGMFEYQVNQLTKEFYVNFEQYMDEGFRDEFASTKINQLRTIPIEKSLTPEHYISTYDELKELIMNARKISVMNCVCRQGKDLIDKPCKATDMRELCFVFNDSVQHIIDNNWGRVISKDEALEILTRIQGEGLILQPGNAQDPNFLCCCCSCCCDLITNMKKLESPWELIHSNYYAEVEYESCVGCLSCLDRCPMEALDQIDDAVQVTKNLCIGCGNCVVVCPEQAITLKKKSKELIPPKTTLDLYKEIMDRKAELRRVEKGNA